MEDILKSVLLNYEKSNFLFDLIKHKTGITYIKIKQSIENDTYSHEIKINPSVLSDIIFILQNFQREFAIPIQKHDKPYFSLETQQEVIKRYFKGITIEDLAMQFNCTKQIIEQIFVSRDIPIVDNKLRKGSKRFRYKKR